MATSLTTVQRRLRQCDAVQYRRSLPHLAPGASQTASHSCGATTTARRLTPPRSPSQCSLAQKFPEPASTIRYSCISAAQPRCLKNDMPRLGKPRQLKEKRRGQGGAGKGRVKTEATNQCALQEVGLSTQRDICGEGSRHYAGLDTLSDRSSWVTTNVGGRSRKKMILRGRGRRRRRRGRSRTTKAQSVKQRVYKTPRNPRLNRNTRIRRRRRTG